jgi:hypothetical protein
MKRSVLALAIAASLTLMAAITASAHPSSNIHIDNGKTHAVVVNKAPPNITGVVLHKAGELGRTGTDDITASSIPENLQPANQSAIATVANAANTPFVEHKRGNGTAAVCASTLVTTESPHAVVSQTATGNAKPPHDAI